MLALILALVTNVIYITGYVIAKAAVGRMPALQVRRPVRLALTLFRSPLWLLALAVELAGLACQVFVLSKEPLVVTELLFLATVPILLGLTRVFLGERVSRGERAALALLLVSVAVVALSLGSGEGDRPIRISVPAQVAMTAAAALVSMLVFGLNASTGKGQRRAPKAGVAYGIAIGLTFGAMGLQTKELAQLAARTPGSGLAGALAHSPYPVMMLACGALGIGGLMVALQRCRASIVVPVFLVVSNWLLLVAGTVMFGSHLPHSEPRLALRGAGLIMTLAVLTLFPRNDPTLPAPAPAPSRRPPARHERAPS